MIINPKGKYVEIKLWEEFLYWQVYKIDYTAGFPFFAVDE